MLLSFFFFFFANPWVNPVATSSIMSHMSVISFHSFPTSVFNNLCHCGFFQSSLLKSPKIWWTLLLSDTVFFKHHISLLVSSLIQCLFDSCHLKTKCNLTSLIIHSLVQLILHSLPAFPWIYSKCTSFHFVLTSFLELLYFQSYPFKQITPTT